MPMWVLPQTLRRAETQQALPNPPDTVLALYNYYLPPVHCQLSHMPMGVLPQTLRRAETRQALPKPADEGFGFI